MNRTKLKNYAPQARRDFIQAVTDRAAYYGLTTKKIEPITERGDIAIIGGKAFPRAIAQKRKALEERIMRLGFEQTMEAMAYTWFNRLMAIRFMELHGYLDHGYRVLSHPEGKAIPEILEHAEHVDLPGLDRNKVIDLKLDGSKEPELYRLLLIAQCNALHAAMPFLFERIDDETELLLPDNLLHSDSLIRKLVNEIAEEDWQEVEIIGWLYQFYISEKKDQVIGKVVKSEDIPAATQLFTPNWIVKYLVQNSLGRQWLATYPNSPLRQQMEYYIEPAEQTPEVQAQLQAITPESLSPEELTLLDPACGSGHILVEAYDLFKAIYQERGYRAKDIPTLILQKNLFGLEIDDRAAQLSAFALMMKARADDRRIFSSGVQPNVLAIQESKDLNVRELVKALNAPLMIERLAVKGDLAEDDIATLVNLFADAKTFGSLIQVPLKLAEKLSAIGQLIRDVLAHGDLMTQPAAKVLLPLVEQAWMLSRQYDCVVANPPYMGGKYFNGRLKDFVAENYEDGKADLYACFILRNILFARSNGMIGMITIPNWMFLSSFEDLRTRLFGKTTICTLVHNGRGVFGSDFGTSSFVIQKAPFPNFMGRYRRLFDKHGSVASIEELRQRFFSARDFAASLRAFTKIPGSPVSYWATESVYKVFGDRKVCDYLTVRAGLTTGNTERFLRYWHEVDYKLISFTCRLQSSVPEKATYIPYNKGGDFRKWYGNNDYVLRYSSSTMAEMGAEKGHRPDGLEMFFAPSITWAKISIGAYSCRFSPGSFGFDATATSAFGREEDLKKAALMLNSSVGGYLLNILNSSMVYLPRDVKNMPWILESVDERSFDSLYELSKCDWDSFETSWDFKTLPWLSSPLRRPSVQKSLQNWLVHCQQISQRMRKLEEQNNRLFVEAYGLQDELSPEVPENQITLARPDREEDIKRLISYAIGCMMGRYSLDKPGLIYACSGNKGFDPSQYKTFPADPDGIVPIMDTDWFPDDAANRVVEFISVAWPKEHLEENLTFIADSLGPNRDEQPRETIRRYLAQSFFKDHLKIYKRRPIYWLFSSGKQRAFQCLVYLHRYHEGTLSRMRTEYVIPLQGKINARIDHLASDIAAATSTSHRKKLEKERDALLKQQAELQAFDEKLRHYADLRISLDLDDGVKVNYGKFGDLLAEVKAVCGEE